MKDGIECALKRTDRSMLKERRFQLPEWSVR